MLQVGDGRRFRKVEGLRTAVFVVAGAAPATNALCAVIFMPVTGMSDRYFEGYCRETLRIVQIAQWRIRPTEPQGYRIRGIGENDFDMI